MDILYRVTWTLPGEPEHFATMDHGASMSLAAALEPLGAVVHRFPPDRPAGRQSAAQSRDDATGAGGLDAGDRAAMGRLARRAFPNDTGRNASYPEDPPRRPDPRDVSSGNGTEFS